MRNDPYRSMTLATHGAIERAKMTIPATVLDRHEPVPWYAHYGLVEEWFGEPVPMARIYNANKLCVAIVPASVARQIVNAVNGEA